MVLPITVVFSYFANLRPRWRKVCLISTYYFLFRRIHCLTHGEGHYTILMQSVHLLSAIEMS